jgi:hypothetical protein
MKKNTPKTKKPVHKEAKKQIAPQYLPESELLKETPPFQWVAQNAHLSCALEYTTSFYTNIGCRL